uniref:Uncharacterized protein n=1 Tax=Panagrolaimus superbus TaxID=310955 RepID=A0A914YG33_9BILA
MNEYMLEFLFNLYKERRHFGFTFSKLDSILRKNYPRYFEELEERRQQSSAVVDRRPPSSQHGRNDTEFRSSRQDNYQPRNDRPQRFEQQQSHSQTCNDSQQRNYRNENFNSQNARDNNYRGSFENRAPTQQNSQRNGTTNNGGRDFYNSNGSYRSNNNGNN